MNACQKCGQLFTVTSRYQSGKFCSRSCANSRSWSKEKRQSLSHKMSGYKFGNADINNPNRKYHNEFIKKCCPICKINFEVPYHRRNNKKYCSINCSRKAPGQGGYRNNSTRKIRSEYRGYWMDSGAERKFAELLDSYNIKWIKNTSRFFNYKDTTGKSRKYYPDFYLPDYDYWVEIKGLLYKNDNDCLKLLSVGDNIELQYHNQIKLPKCINTSLV